MGIEPVKGRRSGSALAAQKGGGPATGVAPDLLSAPAGIILAAGTGTRMGRLKQLLPYQGRPILAHVMANALDAGLSPLVLVLGHAAEKVGHALSDAPDLNRFRIVRNPDYENGMSTSLRAGIQALEAIRDTTIPGAFFLLGDQPFVGPDLIQRLIRAARHHPDQILVPTFQGEKGNPVYFGRPFFPELKTVTGDQGGRDLIRQYPKSVMTLAVDSPGICQDLDTPKDYAVLCQGDPHETD